MTGRATDGGVCDCSGDILVAFAGLAYYGGLCADSLEEFGTEVVPAFGWGAKNREGCV